MDFSHAREKLANRLLERTEQLLLKLVQSAVVAGATDVELSTSTTRVAFTMNGVALPFEGLSRVLNYILQEGTTPTERALKHLAMAVNTAVSTRATGIRLAAWNGTEGQQNHWAVGGRTTGAWVPRRRNQPCTTFELARTEEESRSNLWHLLSTRDIPSMVRDLLPGSSTRNKRGWDADRLLIYEKASYCPVPVRINRKVTPPPTLVVGTSRGRDGDVEMDHSYELWLPVQPGSRGLHTGKPRNPWPGHTFPGPVPGGVLTVGRLEQFMNVVSLLEVTVDGINDRVVAVGGVPRQHYVRGVVACDGMSSDLTGLRPLMDEAFYLHLDGLLENAADMFVSSGLLPAAPKLRVLRPGNR